VGVGGGDVDAAAVGRQGRAEEAAHSHSLGRIRICRSF